MSTVAERVARGAAWLDQKYPQWFLSIDLSILDLSSCNQCVLGQVYAGVIPASERGQVLAQAIMAASQGWDDAEEYEQEYRNNVESGAYGGYNILVDYHELMENGELHGFVARGDGNWVPTDDGGLVWADSQAGKAEYEALLEEWTKVILSRRLALHQIDRVLVAA